MSNEPNGRTPWTDWVIKGRPYTRNNLIAHILQIIEVACAGKANAREVARHFQDPSYLTPAAQKKLRKLLYDLKVRGILDAAEEPGRFRLGSVHSRRLPAQMVHQAQAEAILRREGGRCSYTTMLARQPRDSQGIPIPGAVFGLNKPRDEVINERVWENLRAPGSPIRRDYKRTRFYNLAKTELRNMVLEGRWAIMDAFKAYDMSVPMRQRPDADYSGSGERASVTDEKIALAEHGLRRTGELMQMYCGFREREAAWLLQDEAVRSAVDAAGYRYEDAAWRKNRRGQERRLDLLAKFIDGDLRAHRAMRTDFYLAVGRVLDIDPVDWSWTAAAGFLFDGAQDAAWTTEEETHAEGAEYEDEELFQ